MIKNILISPKVSIDKHGKINHVVEDTWYKFFKSQNINLLTFNSYSSLKIKLKNIKISSVILHGGNDLTCFVKNKENIIREKIDKKILLYAIKKNIPILGVCYGFQLIANFFGTNLKKVNKHVNNKHILNFDNKKKIVRVKVNSFHNYAVYRLPSHFKQIKKCSDNTIEFAYSKNKKIMCTMFHPERKNWNESFIKKIVYKHLDI